MKTDLLPTPEDLTLDEIQSRFSDDDKARAYLETIRWPNGVVCPHCKQSEQSAFWKIEANKKKSIRSGLRQCVPCGKQFTCTVGTIFEDSHIPLRKWLVAWYLLCASKKGISALQIQRMLGLGSYRTAWMMMHKIRYALQNPSFSEKLTGTVEVDETFLGGEVKGRGRGYRGVANTHKHYSINHSGKEYVRREGKVVVSTNTVEGVFSLLKRGVVGTFHHVSKKHLPLYLAEFDARYNARKVTDGERTVASLARMEGKRLTYKTPKMK